MDLENIDVFTLRGLGSINVILGKNGCGKSYLQKEIARVLRERNDSGRVQYISPERGGVLTYEPGIEQSISQNPNWIENERRKNQSANFRQQSATLFRRLELLELREIEQDHTKDGYVPRSFAATIDKLNVLLDRVRLDRDNTQAFKIRLRGNDTETASDQLSSGESELISLGIEFLSYAKEIQAGKTNVLLVDEPDVHLHPDLQSRLAEFIVDVLRGQEITLILATHSTALLASLSALAETRVAFMKRGDRTLTFKAVGEVDKAILPIFGAHPLSNIFNEAPILLLEGEDDERIWQQAQRSANGQIRIFPCAVDGVGKLAEYETEVNNIIEAVYDDAKAYSLRDRDLHPEAIDDVGYVKRVRLSCRAAENLMLTTDVLSIAGTNWGAFKERVEQWVGANAQHQFHADMQAFVASGFDRKGYDLKDIRNILVGLISNKPWEVLVGKGIAQLARNRSRFRIQMGDSLRSYLGEGVCRNLLKLPASSFTL